MCPSQEILVCGKFDMDLTEEKESLHWLSGSLEMRL